MPISISKSRVRLSLIIPYIGALLVVGVQNAVAQSPQFVPAYPLYCAGPLTTSSSSSGGTATPFVWAHAGAGTINPAHGQCAWADRGPSGPEIQGGNGNVICDFSAAMRSVPAGITVEVGVARDPLVHNCLHLTRYIGSVTPPFSGVPALAPFVRQNVDALSAGQIASLRHGIQVMMSRSSTDPTSYRFQANIHGTYDSPVTPNEKASWNQCEHGSFYFLAWHRMYLYFFDRILRAASADPNLVLPYWDWTNPNERTLPVAFRQPNDPSNPLFVPSPGRPSALDDGAASLSADTVDDSEAFADHSYEVGGTFGYGFGGGATAPMQFSDAYGDLEMQPHNVVHSALGGLMGDPLKAAQDPIFWLHHANIDRLGNRWIQEGGGRAFPTDSTWLKTTFTFFDEAGHAVYLTGAEIMRTVGQLNYRYDNDPTPESIQINSKLLGQRSATSNVTKLTPTILSTSVALPTRTRIVLSASTTRLQLPLSNLARATLHGLLSNPVHRLFLRIDDIRTETPPSFYYAIFIDPPANQLLNSHTPGFVGNLSLFSLGQTRTPAGGSAPVNNVFVDYNVSPLLSRILANGPAAASVVLIPRGLVSRDGQQIPLEKGTAASIASVHLIER